MGQPNEKHHSLYRLTQKDPLYCKDFRTWRDRLQQYGIQVVAQEDADYPQLLRQIHRPPLLLYYLGSLQKINSALCLGVVGPRSPSAYGLKVTHSLVSDLTHNGVTIVSGLAWGVDAQAHRTTLEHQGTTFAVVGHSLDYLYPKNHHDLAKAIQETGAMISEYPFDMPPRGNLFPQRNRIISGLSHGTLVIEAKEKSGALITAKWALEQDREVFAVPGTIFSERSLGCHDLIQKGAKLVGSAKDILDELAPLVPQVAKKTKSRYPFSDQELEVMKIIENDRIHLDEILQEVPLQNEVILNILLDFELKGVVQQQPGQFYTVKD